jgi:HEAT repeat protein/DNA-directed RNA polymerase subunit RPC12/RpoP
MAVAAPCPHCRQVNRLDDSQKGQEIRCERCGKGFIVRVKTPSAAGPVAETPARAQVKAGPPRVRAAAEVPSLPEPREVRSPRGLDDVDVIEEDSRPRRRPRDDDGRSRAGGGSGNIGVVLGLVLGGVLILGGIIGAIVYFLAGDTVVLEGPGPAPFIPAVRLHDVVLDPTRPEDFDMMLRLLNHEEEILRRRAHEWLIRANPNHPRRAEVAKILDGRVALYALDGHGHDHFFDAFFAWATMDNVNWLMQMVREKGLGPQQRRRHQAMECLAKLKHEPAIPDMVALLDAFHDRDAAFKALAQMGPVAEKHMLANLNHPDRGARDNVRRLLQSYNTNADKLLTQSVQDLGSVDRERARSAMEYLASAPVDEKRRPDVARAIDNHLTPDARRDGNLMKVVQRWGMPGNVLKLSQMLDEERLGGGDIIKALANIKDPRSAQALAGRISNFFDGKEAQTALINLGPELAEPAAAAQLTNQNREQRINAARVLAVVGTPNSLAALNAAGNAYINDREFGKAALQAIQAIQARAQ